MCQIVAAVENQIVAAKEYELNATILHFLRKTTQWSRMSQIVHCIIPWETVRAGKEIICKKKLLVISFMLLPSFLDMAYTIIICSVLYHGFWNSLIQVAKSIPNCHLILDKKFDELHLHLSTEALIYFRDICPLYQKPEWLILKFLKVLCFF